MPPPAVTSFVKKKARKQRDKPKPSSTKKDSSMRKRGQKMEVVYDPEARRAHLQGFSERKRQRRAFGLAMQRVKDRKAKIEQRAQEKKDDLERIEEAEQQKAELLTEAMLNSGAMKLDDDDDDDDVKEQGELKNNNDSDEEKNDADDKSEEKKESKKEESSKKESSTVIDMKTYDDKKTELHWGGQVIVTTSVVDLDAESDDEESPFSNRVKKSVDTAQQFSGNVDKYMAELKGNMPGRMKDAKNTKRRGKNGAADMKGMGGGANLKMAQKILGKSKSLQEKPSYGSQNKKKGKKPKR
jgi:ribosomal RNA-processing protein 17